MISVSSEPALYTEQVLEQPTISRETMPLNEGVFNRCAKITRLGQNNRYNLRIENGETHATGVKISMSKRVRQTPLEERERT